MVENRGYRAGAWRISRNGRLKTAGAQVGEGSSPEAPACKRGRVPYTGAQRAKPKTAHDGRVNEITDVRFAYIGGWYRDRYSLSCLVKAFLALAISLKHSAFVAQEAATQ